jgi:hypothetical protein
VNRPRRAQVWEQFPPQVLREYALVADGHRGALVGPRGDVVWLCAPSWDSEAVISALVGGDGIYAITPTEPFVWGGYYEPGSLIWHSRWVTGAATIESHKALAAPAGPHRLVLLRRVLAGKQDAAVHVVLDLRTAFGRKSMRQIHRADDGSWTARTGELWIRWSGAPDATVEEAGRLVADLSVAAGKGHDLLREAWVATRRYWAGAVPTLDTCIAPRDARHAYAVLRGLTAPGGGMVAAATLGLPERAHGGRSYDYRYVWLRDQAYAGIAASVDQAYPLMDEAVAFTVARILEHGDQLAPAYRVDGGLLPSETTLSLPGYPGGTDVVGNWVNGQFQLDSMGEILQLLASAARHDRLDDDGHHALMVAVDVIEKRWPEPEAGIWELDDAWWTQSRLSAIAGLRVAAGQVAGSEAGRLSSLADAILAETSSRCLRLDGAWARSPDREGTDASLLLPPVRGALTADDPRTRATIDAVNAELTQDGYAYRFAADDQPLGQAEGAFLLCGFTMALAQWHQGRDVEAFRWFERTSAACGTPALLAEEFDVRQRQLRGNLPQGFVHAMLLETAQRLAQRPGP